MAIAHGAGLVPVPIYLGMCRVADDRGHQAAVHWLAMFAAGGLAAWLVYRHLGLRFVSKGWFNLDATWAVGLMLVGGPALVLSLYGQH